MNGEQVLGSTATIFDSGTTLILGDPICVAKLFEAVNGAQLAPQLGEGIYTSAFSSATNQPIRIHISFNASVPCILDNLISIKVGGTEVNISPASFNFGRVSQDSDFCVAGVAADPSLTGGELIHRFPSQQKETDLNDDIRILDSRRRLSPECLYRFRCW